MDVDVWPLQLPSSRGGDDVGEELGNDLLHTESARSSLRDSESQTASVIARGDLAEDDKMT